MAAPPLERVCRDAPVFRPSAEEFADPLKYLASIKEAGENAGICRIVPPEGWDVPLALNAKTASFPVTVQPVTELQQRLRSGQAVGWRAQYQLFLQQCGEKIAKQPVWGGRPLDLWALYNAVSKRGGYMKVCAEGRWKEVARSLQAMEPSVVLNTTASLSLRTAYERHLVNFELYDFAGEISPVPSAEDENKASPHHASQPSPEQEACAAALVELEQAVPTEPPPTPIVDELDEVSAQPRHFLSATAVPRGRSPLAACPEQSYGARMNRLASPVSFPAE